MLKVGCEEFAGGPPEESNQMLTGLEGQSLELRCEGGIGDPTDRPGQHILSPGSGRHPNEPDGR